MASTRVQVADGSVSRSARTAVWALGLALCVVTAMAIPATAASVRIDAAGNPATSGGWRFPASDVPAWRTVTPVGPANALGTGGLTWGAMPISGALPGRLGQALAFDPWGTTPGMVLFGGYNGSYLGDVWRLALDCPHAWQSVTPAGTAPAARTSPAVVYDSRRHRLVLFGGFDGGNVLADTWALSLDGAPAWTELAPAGAQPPARTAASAVYDSLGDRFVIFGGTTGSGFLADAWALSLAPGGTWRSLAASGTAPSARQYAGAAWDPGRGRMLVFGGYDGSALLADVWALDLGGAPSWTRLAASGGPTARTAAAAAYDPPRDRLLVFGGSTTQGSLSDVWAFSSAGGSWTQLLPYGTSPSARWGPTLAYDAPRGRWLAYGGYGSGYLNDTWKLYFDTYVAGFRFTPAGGLVTSEPNVAATFTAALTTAPAADVHLDLSSSDPSEGVVSPSTLTFTTANWNVAQTVTVTGVDDAIMDGPVAYSVVTAPACSRDPAYDGFNPADLSASNADDDCWDNGISYVDFDGFDLGQPNTRTTAVRMGLHPHVARLMTEDDAAAACWHVPTKSFSAPAGCSEVTGSVEYTPDNGCDPAKLTFSVRDLSGAVSQAGHIVVGDHPMLRQSDLSASNWGGYGSLLDFVRAYAPVLRFETDEHYFPVRPEVNLYRAQLRADGPGAPTAGLSALPSPVTPDDLARYSWSFLTIDEQPCDAGAGAGSEEAFRACARTAGDEAVAAVRLTMDPDCIYATAIRDPGQNALDPADDRIVVQYWMNYYFNDFPVCGTVHEVHEGDWEHVSIAFDTSLHPEQMYFGSHTSATRPWPDVEKWGSTGRPVVYVSLGAHGNFPNRGVVDLCEHHDGDGREFAPTPTEVELLPRWADFTDASVGNRWIEFSGFWGTGDHYTDEFGIDAPPMGLLSGVGPVWRGPAFRKAWTNPLKEEFNNLTIEARTPVDVAVADPAGRVCGPLLTTIPGASYRLVGRDSSGGQDLMLVRLVIPFPRAGGYIVSLADPVAARRSIAASSTISLSSRREWPGRPTETIVIAENLPVSDVPAGGLEVVPDVPHVGASTLEPAAWDGSWTVDDSLAIEWRLTPGSEGFDIASLSPGSLRLNGTVAPLLPVVIQAGELRVRFPRGAALASARDSLGGSPRRVVLTGRFAGSGAWLEAAAMVDITSVAGVDGAVAKSGPFALESPHPNPGADAFEVPVDLGPRGGRLRAWVVDVRGRRISGLADEERGPGRSTLRWNGTGARGERVASGTYWVIATLGGERRVTKVTVVR